MLSALKTDNVAAPELPTGTVTLLLTASTGFARAKRSSPVCLVFEAVCRGLANSAPAGMVSDEPVEPLIRVLVAPADFPLREDVLAAPDGFVGLRASFRAAKRARAA